MSGISRRRNTDLAITMSFRTGNGLSEQRDVPASLHVPMVYEQVTVEPAHWEYRVLIVDTREEDLPDAVQLNELGAQGWLLVAVLEQKISERSSKIQYYFVRQMS
jgi:hypothetical protein